MKNKELGIWCMVICIFQVVMALFQMQNYEAFMKEIMETGVIIEDAINGGVNPVLHLFGMGYDMHGFTLLEVEMWAFTLVSYCIMVVRQLVQCQEDNSYMAIIRYESFYQYYKMVYLRFLQMTIFYQASIWVGACAGAELIRVLGYSLDGSFFQIFQIQVCMLVGNLFFGSIMLYLIVHKDGMKWAIVIYPVFPIVCLIAGNIPRRICNLLPGTWLMFGRSNLMAEEGFPFVMVMVLELLLFLEVSIRFFKKRPD